ncbi:uncharacterized protein LOC128556009 [Mercenaria mercenaria]|uniref:uncharacterized protein LOC128556009 n=1 Tax=Mercenaria mercenaria TaxID=6596 RepID=UPI00234FA06C|nr:uncharacterized protein LOC128556009 [Mercenaria mercenaria]
MSRFLQASYHQGSSRFYGSARQCMANSLSAVVMSQTLNPDDLSSNTLNDILENGDEIYKSSSTDLSCYLMLEDLPKNCKLYSNFIINEISTGLINQTVDYEPYVTLESAIGLALKNEASSCIVTIGQSNPSYSCSLIRRNEKYYFFDPHSRNEVGMPVPDGYATLTVHTTASAVCLFVRHLSAMLFQTISNVQFEISPVQVFVSSSLTSEFGDLSDGSFDGFSDVSEGEITCKLYMLHDDTDLSVSSVSSVNSDDILDESILSEEIQSMNDSSTFFNMFDPSIFDQETECTVFENDYDMGCGDDDKCTVSLSDHDKGSGDTDKCTVSESDHDIGSTDTDKCTVSESDHDMGSGDTDKCTMSERDHDMGSANTDKCTMSESDHDMGSADTDKCTVSESVHDMGSADTDKCTVSESDPDMGSADTDKCTVSESDPDMGSADTDKCTVSESDPDMGSADTDKCTVSESDPDMGSADTDKCTVSESDHDMGSADTDKCTVSESDHDMGSADTDKCTVSESYHDMGSADTDKCTVSESDHDMGSTDTDKCTVSESVHDKGSGDTDKCTVSESVHDTGSADTDKCTVSESDHDTGSADTDKCTVSESDHDTGSADTDKCTVSESVHDTGSADTDKCTVSESVHDTGSADTDKCTVSESVHDTGSTDTDKCTVSENDHDMGSGDTDKCTVSENDHDMGSGDTDKCTVSENDHDMGSGDNYKSGGDNVVYSVTEGGDNTGSDNNGSSNSCVFGSGDMGESDLVSGSANKQHENGVQELGSGDRGRSMNESIELNGDDFGSSIQNGIQDQINKRSRKRQRNPETWKRSILKRRRDSGLSYVGHLGKIKRAKILKPACGISCKKKCTSKINEQQRENIFKEFWGHSSYNKQKHYISSTVNQIPVKRRLVSRQRARHRKCSRQFSFTVDNLKISVCKTFYLATLDITSAKVDSALNQSSQLTGFPTDDSRGKHNVRPNKIHSTIIDDIKDHINSFPRVESHYCRKSSVKEYLDSELNLTKMYELYVEQCHKNNYVPASLHKYRQIFNTQFNIAFNKPLKDQCDLCAEFHSTPDNEKSHLMVKKFERHIRNKNLARQSKDADKSLSQANPSHVTACFDLQQVITLPKAKQSSMYYASKLNNYNLSVYSLGSKEAYCYLWNETTAKRGSCEISSCVFSFFKTLDQQETGIQSVITYSDNCAGQNKNRNFLSMMWLSLRLFHFENISHKFLEKGHTMNENDSVHSSIEKSLKNVPLYTTSQLVTGIQMARRRNPYIVKEMGPSDFYDFSVVADHIRNLRVDTQGNKLRWTEIRCISFNMDMPDTAVIKYDFDGPVVFVNLMPSLRHKPVSVPKLHFLYENGNRPTIPRNKYTDLVRLCDRNIIPPPYQAFYRSLPVSK